MVLLPARKMQISHLDAIIATAEARVERGEFTYKYAMVLADLAYDVREQVARGNVCASTSRMDRVAYIESLSRTIARRAA